MTTDTIYRQDLDDEPFRFNSDVAAVFPDMLRRSIPGYEASLEAIGSLAARFVQDDSQCYDLGCSLGAASLAMRQGIRASGVTINAVDIAPAMIARCREIVAEEERRDPRDIDLNVLQADIIDLDITNASMVTLNYTLQFIAAEQRDALLQRIAAGMRPGGVLLLSEKVVDENPTMEPLLVDLHHEHKRRNDYTALEVARKRAALENVLVPETVAAHKSRLHAAGFSDSAVWLRYFNFVSIIAVR